MTHQSVEELIALKQEVIDGLEEYYGAITNATRFRDAVTADGETLLGVGDIYDAVVVTGLGLALLLKGKVE